MRPGRDAGDANKAATTKRRDDEQDRPSGHPRKNRRSDRCGPPLCAAARGGVDCPRRRSRRRSGPPLAGVDCRAPIRLISSRSQPADLELNSPCQPTATRHDVVVVGARAAGAATALLLARLGYDVVLVDRAVFPADTLSTHQIARTGVVQLHRWGLLEAVLDSGAPAIRQVTFTVEGQSTTRAIKDKAGVDLLVAPRRYILDTLVAEAAAAAGADVRLGVTITGVHLTMPVAPPVCTAMAAPVPRWRSTPGSSWAPTACGSRVARAVGAEITEDRGDDGAAQYAYYAGIPWDGIELIVADRALTGVFPTHHGEACIWICSPSADAHAARRRAASPRGCIHRLPRANRAGPRQAAARRTPYVRGHRHAAHAELLRRAHGPGLGTGRRRRLPPRRDHRARPERRLPRRRATGRRARSGVARRHRGTHRPGRLSAPARQGAARHLRPHLRHGGLPARARNSSTCRSGSAWPSTSRQPPLPPPPFQANANTPSPDAAKATHRPAQSRAAPHPRRAP